MEGCENGNEDHDTRQSNKNRRIKREKGRAAREQFEKGDNLVVQGPMEMVQRRGFFVPC